MNKPFLRHTLPILVQSKFLVVILKVLLEFEGDSLVVGDDAKDVVECLADLLGFRGIKRNLKNILLKASMEFEDLVEAICVINFIPKLIPDSFYADHQVTKLTKQYLCRFVTK
jgi:hypothetical protein